MLARLAPLCLLLVVGCAADLSTPVRPLRSLAAHFTSDDYPAAALVARESGTSAFRLTVGPDGAVSDCAITASSGSSSLDSTTCRLLTARARFVPARDRRGRPTTDTVTGRINWRFPDDGENVVILPQR